MQVIVLYGTWSCTAIALCQHSTEMRVPCNAFHAKDSDWRLGLFFYRGSLTFLGFTSICYKDRPSLLLSRFQVFDVTAIGDILMLPSLALVFRASWLGDGGFCM